MKVHDQVGRSFAEINTELREAERQLKRRQQFRYAQALELAEAGAWEWDAKTDTLWWSPRMFSLYSVDPKTFGGKYADFENSLDPSEVARVTAEVRKANARGVPFRMVFRAKNGEYILSSGRMEEGIMHGINMNADHGKCVDCPFTNKRSTLTKPTETA